MNYNKRQYTKVNDKKVLHKVRKQWVTISVAMLGMLGLGVGTAYTSASASADDDQSLEQHITDNFAKARRQAVSQPMQHTANGRHMNAYNPKNIEKQANLMTQHLMRLSATNGKEQNGDKTSASNGQPNSENELNSTNPLDSTNQNNTPKKYTLGGSKPSSKVSYPSGYLVDNNIYLPGQNTPITLAGKPNAPFTAPNGAVYKLERGSQGIRVFSVTKSGSKYVSRDITKYLQKGAQVPKDINIPSLNTNLQPYNISDIKINILPDKVKGTYGKLDKSQIANHLTIFGYPGEYVKIPFSDISIKDGLLTNISDYTPIALPNNLNDNETSSISETNYNFQNIINSKPNAEPHTTINNQVVPLTINPSDMDKSSNNFLIYQLGNNRKITPVDGNDKDNYETIDLQYYPTVLVYKYQEMTANSNGDLVPDGKSYEDENLPILSDSSDNINNGEVNVRDLKNLNETLIYNGIHNVKNYYDLYHNSSAFRFPSNKNSNGHYSASGNKSDYSPYSINIINLSDTSVPTPIPFIIAPAGYTPEQINKALDKSSDDGTVAKLSTKVLGSVHHSNPLTSATDPKISDNYSLGFDSAVHNWFNLNRANRPKELDKLRNYDPSQLSFNVSGDAVTGFLPQWNGNSKFYMISRNNKPYPVVQYTQATSFKTKLPYVIAPDSDTNVQSEVTNNSNPSAVAKKYIDVYATTNNSHTLNSDYSDYYNYNNYHQHMVPDVKSYIGNLQNTLQTPKISYSSDASTMIPSDTSYYTDNDNNTTWTTNGSNDHISSLDADHLNDWVTLKDAKGNNIQVPVIRYQKTYHISNPLNYIIAPSDANSDQIKAASLGKDSTDSSNNPIHEFSSDFSGNRLSDMNSSTSYSADSKIDPSVQTWINDENMSNHNQTLGTSTVQNDYSIQPNTNKDIEYNANADNKLNWATQNGHQIKYVDANGHIVPVIRYKVQKKITGNLHVLIAPDNDNNPTNPSDTQSDQIKATVTIPNSNNNSGYIPKSDLNNILSDFVNTKNKGINTHKEKYVAEDYKDNKSFQVGAKGSNYPFIWNSNLMSDSHARYNTSLSNFEDLGNNQTRLVLRYFHRTNVSDQIPFIVAPAYESNTDIQNDLEANGSKAYPDKSTRSFEFTNVKFNGFRGTDGRGTSNSDQPDKAINFGDDYKNDVKEFNRSITINNNSETETDHIDSNSENAPTFRVAAFPQKGKSDLNWNSDQNKSYAAPAENYINQNGKNIPIIRYVRSFKKNLPFIVAPAYMPISQMNGSNLSTGSDPATKNSTNSDQYTGSDYGTHAYEYTNVPFSGDSVTNNSSNSRNYNANSSDHYNADVSNYWNSLKPTYLYDVDGNKTTSRVLDKSSSNYTNKDAYVFKVTYKVMPDTASAPSYQVNKDNIDHVTWNADNNIDGAKQGDKNNVNGIPVIRYIKTLTLIKSPKPLNIVKRIPGTNKYVPVTSDSDLPDTSDISDIFKRHSDTYSDNYHNPYSDYFSDNNKHQDHTHRYNKIVISDGKVVVKQEYLDDNYLPFIIAPDSNELTNNQIANIFKNNKKGNSDVGILSSHFLGQDGDTGLPANTESYNVNSDSPQRKQNAQGNMDYRNTLSDWLTANKNTISNKGHNTNISDIQHPLDNKGSYYTYKYQLESDTEKAPLYEVGNGKDNISNNVFKWQSLKNGASNADIYRNNDQYQLLNKNDQPTKSWLPIIRYKKVYTFHLHLPVKIGSDYQTKNYSDGYLSDKFSVSDNRTSGSNFEKLVNGMVLNDSSDNPVTNTTVYNSNDSKASLYNKSDVSGSSAHSSFDNKYSDGSGKGAITKFPIHLNLTNNEPSSFSWGTSKSDIKSNTRSGNQSNGEPYEPDVYTSTNKPNEPIYRYATYYVDKYPVILQDQNGNRTYAYINGNIQLPKGQGYTPGQALSDDVNVADLARYDFNTLQGDPNNLPPSDDMTFVSKPDASDNSYYKINPADLTTATVNNNSDLVGSWNPSKNDETNIEWVTPSNVDAGMSNSGQVPSNWENTFANSKVRQNFKGANAKIPVLYYYTPAVTTNVKIPNVEVGSDYQTKGYTSLSDFGASFSVTGRVINKVANGSSSDHNLIDITPNSNGLGNMKSSDVKNSSGDVIGKRYTFSDVPLLNDIEASNDGAFKGYDPDTRNSNNVNNLKLTITVKDPTLINGDQINPNDITATWSKGTQDTNNDNNNVGKNSLNTPNWDNNHPIVRYIPKIVQYFRVYVGSDTQNSDFHQIEVPFSDDINSTNKTVTLRDVWNRVYAYYHLDNSDNSVSDTGLSGSTLNPDTTFDSDDSQGKPDSKGQTNRYSNKGEDRLVLHFGDEPVPNKEAGEPKDNTNTGSTYMSPEGTDGSINAPITLSDGTNKYSDTSANFNRPYWTDPNNSDKSVNGPILRYRNMVEVTLPVALEPEPVAYNSNNHNSYITQPYPNVYTQNGAKPVMIAYLRFKLPHELKWEMENHTSKKINVDTILDNMTDFQVILKGKGQNNTGTVSDLQNYISSILRNETPGALVGLQNYVLNNLKANPSLIGGLLDGAVKSLNVLAEQDPTTYNNLKNDVIKVLSSSDGQKDIKALEKDALNSVKGNNEVIQGLTSIANGGSNILNDMDTIAKNPVNSTAFNNALNDINNTVLNDLKKQPTLLVDLATAVLNTVNTLKNSPKNSSNRAAYSDLNNAISDTLAHPDTQALANAETQLVNLFTKSPQFISTLTDMLRKDPQVLDKIDTSLLNSNNNNQDPRWLINLLSYVVDSVSNLSPGDFNNLSNSIANALSNNSSSVNDFENQVLNVVNQNLVTNPVFIKDLVKSLLSPSGQNALGGINEDVLNNNQKNPATFLTLCSDVLDAFQTLKKNNPTKYNTLNSNILNALNAPSDKNELTNIQNSIETLAESGLKNGSTSYLEKYPSLVLQLGLDAFDELNKFKTNYPKDYKTLNNEILTSIRTDPNDVPNIVSHALDVIESSPKLLNDVITVLSNNPNAFNTFTEHALSDIKNDPSGAIKLVSDAFNVFNSDLTSSSDNRSQNARKVVNDLSTINSSNITKGIVGLLNDKVVSDVKADPSSYLNLINSPAVIKSFLNTHDGKNIESEINNIINTDSNFRNDLISIFNGANQPGLINELASNNPSISAVETALNVLKNFSQRGSEAHKLLNSDISSAINSNPSEVNKIVGYVKDFNSNNSSEFIRENYRNILNDIKQNPNTVKNIVGEILSLLKSAPSNQKVANDISNVQKGVINALPQLTNDLINVLKVTPNDQKLKTFESDISNQLNSKPSDAIGLGTDALNALIPLANEPSTTTNPSEFSKISADLAQALQNKPSDVSAIESSLNNILSSLTPYVIGSVNSNPQSLLDFTQDVVNDIKNLKNSNSEEFNDLNNSVISVLQNNQSTLEGIENSILHILNNPKNDELVPSIVQLLQSKPGTIQFINNTIVNDILQGDPRSNLGLLTNLTHDALDAANSLYNTDKPDYNNLQNNIQQLLTNNQNTVKAIQDSVLNILSQNPNVVTGFAKELTNSQNSKVLSDLNSNILSGLQKDPSLLANTGTDILNAIQSQDPTTFKHLQSDIYDVLSNPQNANNIIQLEKNILNNLKSSTANTSLLSNLTNDIDRSSTTLSNLEKEFTKVVSDANNTSEANQLDPDLSKLNTSLVNAMSNNPDLVNELGASILNALKNSPSTLNSLESTLINDLSKDPKAVSNIETLMFSVLHSKNNSGPINVLINSILGVLKSNVNNAINFTEQIYGQEVDVNTIMQGLIAYADNEYKLPNVNNADVNHTINSKNDMSTSNNGYWSTSDKDYINPNDPNQKYTSDNSYDIRLNNQSDKNRILFHLPKWYTGINSDNNVSDPNADPADKGHALPIIYYLPQYQPQISVIDHYWTPKYNASQSSLAQILSGQESNDQTLDKTLNSDSKLTQQQLDGSNISDGRNSDYNQGLPSNSDYGYINYLNTDRDLNNKGQIVKSSWRSDRTSDRTKPWLYVRNAAGQTNAYFRSMNHSLPEQAIIGDIIPIYDNVIDPERPVLARIGYNGQPRVLNSLSDNTDPGLKDTSTNSGNQNDSFTLDMGHNFPYPSDENLLKSDLYGDTGLDYHTFLTNIGIENEPSDTATIKVNGSTETLNNINKRLLFYPTYVNNEGKYVPSANPLYVTVKKGNTTYEYPCPFISGQYFTPTIGTDGASADYSKLSPIEYNDAPSNSLPGKDKTNAQGQKLNNNSDRYFITHNHITPLKSYTIKFLNAASTMNPSDLPDPVPVSETHVIAPVGVTFHYYPNNQVVYETNALGQTFPVACLDPQMNNNASSQHKQYGGQNSNLLYHLNINPNEFTTDTEWQDDGMNGNYNSTGKAHSKDIYLRSDNGTGELIHLPENVSDALFNWHSSNQYTFDPNDPKDDVTNGNETGYYADPETVNNVKDIKNGNLPDYQQHLQWNSHYTYGPSYLNRYLKDHNLKPVNSNETNEIPLYVHPKDSDTVRIHVDYINLDDNDLLGTTKTSVLKPSDVKYFNMLNYIPTYNASNGDYEIGTNDRRALNLHDGGPNGSEAGPFQYVTTSTNPHYYSGATDLTAYVFLSEHSPSDMVNHNLGLNVVYVNADTGDPFYFDKNKQLQYGKLPSNTRQISDYVIDKNIKDNIDDNPYVLVDNTGEVTNDSKGYYFIDKNGNKHFISDSYVDRDGSTHSGVDYVIDSKGIKRPIELTMHTDNNYKPISDGDYKPLKFTPTGETKSDWARTLPSLNQALSDNRTGSNSDAVISRLSKFYKSKWAPVNVSYYKYIADSGKNVQGEPDLSNPDSTYYKNVEKTPVFTNGAFPFNGPIYEKNDRIVYDGNGSAFLRGVVVIALRQAPFNNRIQFVDVDNLSDETTTPNGTTDNVGAHNLPSEWDIPINKNDTPATINSDINHELNDLKGAHLVLKPVNPVKTFNDSDSTSEGQTDSDTIDGIKLPNFGHASYKIILMHDNQIHRYDPILFNQNIYARFVYNKGTTDHPVYSDVPQNELPYAYRNAPTGNKLSDIQKEPWFTSSDGDSLSGSNLYPIPEFHNPNTYGYDSPTYTSDLYTGIVNQLSGHRHGGYTTNSQNENILNDASDQPMNKIPGKGDLEMNQATNSHYILGDMGTIDGYVTPDSDISSLAWYNRSSDPNDDNQSDALVNVLLPFVAKNVKTGNYMKNKYNAIPINGSYNAATQFNAEMYMVPAIIRKKDPKTGLTEAVNNLKSFLSDAKDLQNTSPTYKLNMNNYENEVSALVKAENSNPGAAIASVDPEDKAPLGTIPKAGLTKNMYQVITYVKTAPSPLIVKYHDITPGDNRSDLSQYNFRYSDGQTNNEKVNFPNMPSNYTQAYTKSIPTMTSDGKSIVPILDDTGRADTNEFIPQGYVWTGFNDAHAGNTFGYTSISDSKPRNSQHWLSSNDFNKNDMESLFGLFSQLKQHPSDGTVKGNFNPIQSKPDVVNIYLVKPHLPNTAEEKVTIEVNGDSDVKQYQNDPGFPEVRSISSNSDKYGFPYEKGFPMEKIPKHILIHDPNTNKLTRYVMQVNVVQDNDPSDTSSSKHDDALVQTSNNNTSDLIPGFNPSSDNNSIPGEFESGHYDNDHRPDSTNSYHTRNFHYHYVVNYVPDKLANEVVEYEINGVPYNATLSTDPLSQVIRTTRKSDQTHDWTPINIPTSKTDSKLIGYKPEVITNTPINQVINGVIPDYQKSSDVNDGEFSSKLYQGLKNNRPYYLAEYIINYVPERANETINYQVNGKKISDGFRHKHSNQKFSDENRWSGPASTSGKTNPWPSDTIPQIPGFKRIITFNGNGINTNDVPSYNTSDGTNGEFNSDYYNKQNHTYEYHYVINYVPEKAHELVHYEVNGKPVTKEFKKSNPKAHLSDINNWSGPATKSDKTVDWNGIKIPQIPGYTFTVVTTNGTPVSGNKIPGYTTSNGSNGEFDPSHYDSKDNTFEFKYVINYTPIPQPIPQATVEHGSEVVHFEINGQSVPAGSVPGLPSDVSRSDTSSDVNQGWLPVNVPQTIKVNGKTYVAAIIAEPNDAQIANGYVPGYQDNSDNGNGEFSPSHTVPGTNGLNHHVEYIINYVPAKVPATAKVVVIKGHHKKTYIIHGDQGTPINYKKYIPKHERYRFGKHDVVIINKHTNVIYIVPKRQHSKEMIRVPKQDRITRRIVNIRHVPYLIVRRGKLVIRKIRLTTPHVHKVTTPRHKLPQTSDTHVHTSVWAAVFASVSAMMAGLGHAIGFKKHRE